MKSLKASNYNIHFTDNDYHIFNDFLNNTSFSTLFILVDSHTKNKCLPIFMAKVDPKFDFKIITIPSGEDYKTLTTCEQVWQELTTLQADRKSILINICGGMVTDLGGFAAATFKRGMRFINISTSLLGMVDASVGGKTGVDFNGLKNQIGLFSNPELVLIDPIFLKTLPQRELISGMAEIIKYGLTYDNNLWKEIKKSTNYTDKQLSDWIFRSIEIKNEIVIKDPFEGKLRKILNYGHTIGHAIETYYLKNPNMQTLTHGEAIAIGLICETYIATKQFNFPEKELHAIKKYIQTLFGKVTFNETDFNSILELMKHDKKNINGNVRFVLLEKIGNCRIDCQVNESLIVESLNYYLQ